MIPCARFAFFTLARDACFVTLAAATMMVGFSFEPSLAFKIGATVALVFAILLLGRSYFLTEERFLRSEAWRALRPEERPAGEHGRQLARAYVQELMLRFAKSASAIAGVLYCSALVTEAMAPQPWL
jgi:hypothetical protein